MFLQTGTGRQSPQGQKITATADAFGDELSILSCAASDPVLLDSGPITRDEIGSVVAGQIIAQDGTVRQIRLVQAVYR